MAHLIGCVRIQKGKMVSVKEDATVQAAPGTTAAAQTGGRLRNHLIKGAAGGFILQVGFAGFAFLNAIILARVLGADGYGAFANAMAWVSLLTIPATFGFGILLVRDTAIYRSQGKWGLLKGLLHFSNRIVLGLSVVLALIGAGVAGWMFASPAQAMMRHTIWIALLLLPLFALYNLREAVMRGLEHVIRARFPGMIVRPGLLLLGIVAIYFFRPQQLSAQAAMAVNVGAGEIALVLSIFFLRSVFPKEAKAATPEYTSRPWLKAAFPMLVYGGAQIVLGQTDIVMLGAMRGAHEVGLYAVANRMALIIGYTMMAAEIIIAPIIARLYAKADKEKLQNILTKAVRISFFSILPFGIIFIFAGNYVLQFFGKEFIVANSALSILTIGRLVHVALGPGALLLSMTGHEKSVANIVAIAAFLNIIANSVLIPLYGINGAAIASAVSLILMRIALSLYALQRTNINVTIVNYHCIWKRL